MYYNIVIIIIIINYNNFFDYMPVPNLSALNTYVDLHVMHSKISAIKSETILILLVLLFNTKVMHCFLSVP